MSDATASPICVYPQCPNTVRTRGLCHNHYQTARSYIRDGKTTEDDLRRRGLMLTKNDPQGKPAHVGNDLFLAPGRGAAGQANGWRIDWHNGRTWIEVPGYMFATREQADDYANDLRKAGPDRQWRVIRAGGGS